MIVMTADQVRSLLRRVCLEAGSVRAWAMRNGTSPQYVGDVISGKREPGPAVLNPLGLEKHVDYRPERAERKEPT